MPSPLQSHSVNAEYSVITCQSELHRLRRCLIARVIKPDVSAAPSLHIHERRENIIERRRACTPVPRRPPRTTMHLGLSSSRLHFTLSCLALFCRLAVEFFFYFYYYYCHLWIGSQLIYSQRVTGKHPTCYFGSAQIIIIIMIAVMMEGTAADVSEGFSSL